jgi:hypothetical protein
MLKVCLVKASRTEIAFDRNMTLGMLVKAWWEDIVRDEETS